MELAAFASFGILVLAWIVLPLRTPSSVPAAEPLAEPVAA